MRLGERGPTDVHELPQPKKKTAAKKQPAKQTGGEEDGRPPVAQRLEPGAAEHDIRGRHLRRALPRSVSSRLVAQLVLYNPSRL
ncbi:hypothetical protein [Streptomyces sp. enrichment culture]|uniref:hypothetical protein n=1 Tax=Streptomyces sp. enrichment culture TaxID=1795815 RepID=UPI003F54A3F4